jgi:hypothetical protein
MQGSNLRPLLGVDDAVWAAAQALHKLSHFCNAGE